jgi:hypothetical protein
MHQKSNTNHRNQETEPFKGVDVEAIDFGEGWVGAYYIRQILEVADAVRQTDGQFGADLWEAMSSLSRQ